ncbi:MAG TPA: hypothetical protein VLE45_08735, partial [Burkholderiaceae bacterium]|nr:hypothetical protein [Burkholderiaceae bacterium]
MQRLMSFANKCRRVVAALACGCAGAVALAQVTGGTPVPQIQDPVLGTTGPYQLRDSTPVGAQGNVYIPSSPRASDLIPGRYVPGEFEIYVNRLANSPPDAPIRRFGANLVTG